MRLSNQLHCFQNPPLTISMTSMIDVVFLLLIFFLVTTTFIEPEKQLLSSIAVEQTDAGLQFNDLEPAVVEIYTVGNTVLFQMGAVKTSNQSQLSQIISTFPNKSEGGFVRVAKNVPFESVAQIIGLLKSNGFENVSYLPAK